MSELMNQAQRTSVFVALRTFEQYLRQLDRWLQGLEGDFRGVWLEPKQKNYASIPGGSKQSSM
jgi:hypothetical protein